MKGLMSSGGFLLLSRPGPSLCQRSMPDADHSACSRRCRNMRPIIPAVIWRKFGARAAGGRHAYLAFMSGYLVPDTDRHDRASTLSCLGTVALERFADARAAGEDEPVLLEHLNAALRSYQQSLELTPADDHQARGAREHQLGIVYSRAEDTSQALRHYQRSSR